MSDSNSSSLGALKSHLRETISRVVATLQNPASTSSDIFYAIYTAAFLPGCPTCPSAVKEIGVPFILELVGHEFPRASQIRTMSRNYDHRNKHNGSDVHSFGYSFIVTMCQEQQQQAEVALDEWLKLLCRLVFSRMVEIHLALSPSPFENKGKWYTGARVGLTDSTEATLSLSRDLLRKTMTSSPSSSSSPSSVGVASGMIATCAVVLLRAIHVEHIVDQLRSADPYLGQVLKSLEVEKRHARDMFSICNASRSIDMLAVHCPLFVVIAAACMGKLPAVRQLEKDRRETRFSQTCAALKAAEDSKLQAIQSQRSGNHSNNTSMVHQHQQQQQGFGESREDSAMSSSSSVPEPMIDWTNHMLRHAGAPLNLQNQNNNNNNNNNNSSGSGGGFDNNNGGAEDIFGGSGATQQQQQQQQQQSQSTLFGMGHIPAGILRGGGTINNNNNVGDDQNNISDDAQQHQEQQWEMPVDVFAKMFIAGRLAAEFITRQNAAEAAYSNAATAFACCRDDSECAVPFAEIATIARLRLGDAPNGQADTLRGLGCTVLLDICLALHCGHPRAFDAAVQDAAQELASRGLLSAVLTLRTHAVMMLVKKYLRHNSESMEAKRLDVEDFFSRYREQLPRTLLDTEMQMIVPLILGQRLKGRLENSTLVLAADPLAFDQ